MTAPQIEPRIEVRRTDPERKVALRHRPAITRRAARGTGPEIRNLFQVRRPIVNLCPKNRPNDLVLPHVGIEVAQQQQDPLPAAEAVE